MEALKEFYGKDVAYVHTVFKGGRTEHQITTKKVYDPHDRTKRIRPANGCDIVIGDNSTSSKYIYSIGGVQHSNSVGTFEHLGQISIFTYCRLEETEVVINRHIQEVMVILNAYVDLYTKKVAEVMEWI